MTSRQAFENSLIELNKVGAPDILLEVFNYIINKAIYNYLSSRYTADELNQQITDDLRVLKKTLYLPVTKSTVSSPLYGAAYTADLPRDYFHLESCLVEYKLDSDFKCNKKDDLLHYPAKRLTADIWASIQNNVYLRPSYKLPYYKVHNNDPIVDTNPTNPDVPEITPGSRWGNSSQPMIEIRYGKDDSVFKIQQVHIDYIRAPQHIELTQAQFDSSNDTSQVLEFPEYACYEIVKEIVKLLLENNSDPRLQTNIPVNMAVPPVVNGGR